MIKNSRYIIKKVIIGTLIGIALMFAKMYIPHAEVFNLNAWANNSYLRPGAFVGASGHTVHMKVDYIGYPEGINDPTETWYVSLAICRTWADSGITYTQSGSASSSFGIQNTQIPCPFSNSPYNLTGFLTIITYKQTGGGSYNNAQFDIYTVENTSGTYYSDIQLVDLSIDINRFKTVYDYANLGNQVNSNNMVSGINSLNDKLLQAITQMQQNQTSTNTWLERVRDAVKQMHDTMNDDGIDENDQDSKINNIKNSGYNNNSISAIVLLPVKVFESAVTGLSSNSCSPINLGSLYNTDLILPCISSSDMQTWLSSSVYSLIDILMSFCVILGIRKLVLKIYSTIVYLREGGGTID